MDKESSAEVDKVLLRQCTCGGVANKLPCVPQCFIFIAGEPPSCKPAFHRTREALESYDATKPLRTKLWEKSYMEADIHECKLVEQAAADLVRNAFVLDTQEINQAARARLIHPDDPWLRKTVELKK